NSTKDNFAVTEHAQIAREILIMFGIQHIRPAVIVSHLEEHNYPSPGLIEYRRLEALYNNKKDSGRLNQAEYEKKIQSAKRFLGTGKWNLGSLYRLVSQVDLYAGKYSFTVSGQPFTVDVPAIITEDEAEEVRKMRAVTRGRFERKRVTKHPFLLARRLYCAHCNRSMAVSYSPQAYLYYRCSGNTKRGNYTCDQKPVTAKLVDGKSKDFIRELLLNPRRLFAWWQEQQNATAKDREQAEQDVAALEGKVKTTTEKYHRILDRLTDNLDTDEIAYYAVKRDSLKTLLVEYREELDSLLAKHTTVQVDESVVKDFMEMGQEYREILETSEDFTFWRGLVEDLDITAVVGYEDERRFVEFIVFKKVRRKFYLIEKHNSAIYQEELPETQTLKHNTTMTGTPRSATR
ncbi:MAG: zinc ribbon domain-containing protein, partial [Chloroflexota bacterium]|nr:zinc ribbon domain-containing protein [Chloroflexota bacterium]